MVFMHAACGVCGSYDPPTAYGFAGTTTEMPQRETATSGSAASALRGSGLHRLFFDATLERNSKVT